MVPGDAVGGNEEGLCVDQVDISFVRTHVQPLGAIAVGEGAGSGEGGGGGGDVSIHMLTCTYV